jgi:hypothetical protein
MKAKKHKARSNQNTRISQAMQAPEQMDIVNRNAAGIDCGAREHYAAVPPDSVKLGEPIVRSFSAFTQGLDAVEWFKVCGVTTVAMESTGVLLDSALPEAGSSRFRSIFGQRSAHPPRSRPQD